MRNCSLRPPPEEKEALTTQCPPIDASATDYPWAPVLVATAPSRSMVRSSIRQCQDHHEDQQGEGNRLRPPLDVSQMEARQSPTYPCAPPRHWLRRSRVHAPSPDAHGHAQVLPPGRGPSSRGRDPHRDCGCGRAHGGRSHAHGDHPYAASSRGHDEEKGCDDELQESGHDHGGRRARHGRAGSQNQSARKPTAEYGPTRQGQNK